MTKIRDNMTTAFAVFAGMFIIYVVLDWGLDLTGRKGQHRQKNILGSVNGTEFTYEEFAEKLRETIDQQKKQNKDMDLDENSMNNLREQLWNSLVNEELLNQEAKKLGIQVTDDEIRDWVFGPNPPQFLTSQFTDSAGNFNRENYVSALKDPRNKTIILQVEKSMRQMRMQEKIQSILLSTQQVSEGEILDKFYENNQKMDAEYVLFDPNVLVKDSVGLSDGDMQQFYQEHIDEFHQDASRRLAYVMFKEEPSKNDSSDIMKDFDDIIQKSKSGEDFLELLKHYSDVPASDAFFKHGELSKVREDAVFNAKIGDVIGPLQDNDGYHLIKVLEEKNDTSQFVKASHILFKLDADSIKTKKTVNEVLQRAKKGEDFAALAKQYSTDGSASNGGDLGWFGKGRMVKEFENAAFKAKVGEVVGPVRSQFGLHIIKLTGRDNRSLKIGDIVMSVKASSKTRSEVFQKAQSFLASAKEIGVDSAAKKMSLEVKRTASFNEKSNFVPGIGQEARLVRFAFEKELNAVSEILTTQQGYGVFQLIEKKEEGAKPLQEVESTIKVRALRGKKIQKLAPLANEMRSKLSQGDSLNKLTSLNPILKVTNAQAISPNGTVASLGRDLFFLGAVSKLNVGEISQPVENPNRGYYIIHLLSRTPFDSAAFTSQKESIRKQLLDGKRNKFMNEWLNNLKKEATIVDNRDTFYK